MPFIFSSLFQFYLVSTNRSFTFVWVLSKRPPTEFLHKFPFSPHPVTNRMFERYFDIESENFSKFN